MNHPRPPDTASNRYDRSMFLRITRRLTGNAFVRGNTLSPLQGDHHDKVGNHHDRAGKQNDRTAQTVEIIDNTPPMENDDPMRRRFSRRWRTWPERIIKRMKSMIAYMRSIMDRNRPLDERLMMLRLRRELLEEERTALEENRNRRALYKSLEEQAVIAKKYIVSTLTRLGFCYRREQEGREVRLDQIGFDIVKISPLAFYFHINGSNMPRLVRSLDLVADSTVTELSVSLGHKVRGLLDTNHGVIFVVEISSTLGIPDFVTFEDAFKKMPNNLPALSFPVGFTENSRTVYRSLEDMPHLLVAGGSGSGKSNEINVIICSLILRNRPDRMGLILFDMKRGVEFGHYEGLPHLQPLVWDNDGKQCKSIGIIETLDDVVPALKCIERIGNERLDIIKSAGFRDITGYNARKREHKRMPRLVVVFDEWANVKLMLGKEAEKALTNITNLFRAAGIHVILATQNPKAEILNTVITTNFQTRMAFSMPPTGSQVVLGNWNAAGLSPKGRMVYQSPDEEKTIQAPRITDATISSIVNEACGRGSAIMTSLDPNEILEWALENDDGKLRFEKLFAQFEKQISKHGLTAMLKDMDNNIFIINDTKYVITPARGSLPRKMELSDE